MKLSNIVKKSAFLPIAALAVTSCSHDELELYSGTPAAVFIQMVKSYDQYGNPIAYTQHAGPISFNNVNASITTSYTYFTVSLAGEVKDYDRPYKLIIDEENTDAIEGVDFDISENEFCIKAGKASDQVRVKIIRNERLTKGVLTAAFKLLPNEYFTLDIDHFKSTSNWNVEGEILDASIYSISFSEIYTAPSSWYQFSGSFLGDFSVRKFNLLNTIMGWALSDWSNANAAGSKVTTAKMGYATTALRNRLIEEAKNGTPVLEEDGTPMQLAGNYEIDYSLYE